MTYRALAAALLLLCITLPSHAEKMLVHSDVFVSGADGYKGYRIPAIATAPDGSLIAFAEARKYSFGDPGGKGQEIDLVCKRSTDDGKTWSAMNVVEHAGEKWSSANPALIVDRQTKRVFVLYLRSKPGRGSSSSRPGTDDMMTLVRSSDDNGQTWSQPTDITAVARDMADPAWRSTVVGPGGMIQDSKGRLIASCWKSPFNAFAIFSEDHGKTWQRGQMVPVKAIGDEDELVELADGKIMLDIRQGKGTHRWLCTSDDGGRTWSQPKPGQTVTPVACSIRRYTLKSAGDDRDRLLWTGPQGPKRNILRVHVSYDEGATFPVTRVLSDGPAAYSDIAILNDKTVGVLWERDNYKFITFTRFNREFLEEPEGAKKP